MTSHPLLVRQPDAPGVVSVSRAHRTARQRGTIRYNPSTQTLHASFLRPPNPPVLLTNVTGSQNPAQIILGNDVHRPEDDILEDLFQESFLDDNSAGSNVLTYIPSTLTRWTEEAKVLDGDSVNDCMPCK